MIVLQDDHSLSSCKTIIVLQHDPARSVCVGFWSTMAQSKRLDELDPLKVSAVNDESLCQWSKSFGPNDHRLEGRHWIILSKRPSFGGLSYRHQFWSTMAQSNRLRKPHPLMTSILNVIDLCHGSKSFGRTKIVWQNDVGGSPSFCRTSYRLQFWFDLG